MRRGMMAVSSMVVFFGVWSVAGVVYPPLANAIAALATWQWQSEPLTPAGNALLAISGGVMVGWGVNLILLCRETELSARRFTAIVRTSTLTWFVVDSAASLAAEAAPNVLLNTVLLALTWWSTRAAQENEVRPPAPAAA